MNYSAVILGAGSGTRFQSKKNKVWHVLGNEPIIFQSIRKFLQDPECLQTIVVIAANDKEYAATLQVEFPTILITTGGSVREESVWNALKLVNQPFVMIHDGARPFFTTSLVHSIKERLGHHDSVIPGILMKKGEFHPDRVVIVNQHSYRIQTPQAFQSSLAFRAFEKCFKTGRLSDFRDDASIIEEYEHVAPVIVPGESENIKITYPTDLKGNE